jgi:myosin heavy subunit
LTALTLIPRVISFTAPLFDNFFLKTEAESREFESSRRIAELERELRRMTAQMQSYSLAPDFVDTSASMRRAHDVLARECKGLRQVTHQNTNRRFDDMINDHHPCAHGYHTMVLESYQLSQALQHAQQQLASSTSDSMKREVETLRASLAQAQAELSLGSRDQLNQELTTCRAALEAANADNERLRSSHKCSMDAAIGEAQEARNEYAAAAAKISRLQHELAQVKRDLADAAPKAQRCIDAEKASQADELKAVTAAAAAEAATSAARDAKDAMRQLQQELHDEQRRAALLAQDVEYAHALQAACKM